MELVASGEDNYLNGCLPIFMRVQILEIHNRVGKRSSSARARNGKGVGILVSACYERQTYS